MKQIITLLLTLNFGHLFANQIPQLTQCHITIVDNNLEISYELIDPDNNQLEVRCNIFFSSGIKKNELVAIKSITGDIGFPVKVGSNKKLIISLVDLTELNSNLRVSLSAYDQETMDINEIINQVDKTRIYKELETLQGRRNETTDKNFKEKSREYILDQLNSIGLINKFESKIGNLTNINYELTRWGTNDPSSIQIVDAHYDSFGQAPGVDDNASGVSGVLEVFRILSQYASKKSLRFLFFDLEENGLVGSNLYINNQLNSKDKIAHVINFEMIGYYSDLDNTQDLPVGFNILFPEAYNDVLANNRKGNFITNVGNTTSKTLIEHFSNAANKYVPNLKVISLEVPGNGTAVPDLRRSDHANFWDKGYRALMITDGANFRNKNYHSIRDSLQYLNMDFMGSVIKTTIATLIELGEFEHGTSVDLFYTGATSISNGKSDQWNSFQNGDKYSVIPANLSEPYEVKIIDLNGKIIYSRNTTNVLEIDLTNNFNSGVLFLSIKSKNKKQIKKIFVTN